MTANLFFFQAVGRGAHILLCMLAEGRRVDALDRFHQLFRPKADVAALIGQHEGFVHARERLVLRVFQQAGRAHGERVMNFLQQFPQIFPKAGRQRRRQKPLLDLGFIGAVEGEIQKLVLLQELVEQVGGQHERRRHGDSDPGESLCHRVLAQ